MVQLFKDPITKQVKINNFGGFQRNVNQPNAGFTLDGDGQSGKFTLDGDSVLLYRGGVFLFENCYFIEPDVVLLVLHFLFFQFAYHPLSLRLWLVCHRFQTWLRVRFVSLIGCV